MKAAVLEHRGADAESSQRNHREFPPVGKLNGNDVARTDAKTLQAGRRARDQVSEFGVSEAPRFMAIGAVGQKRELVRRRRDGRLKKFVKTLVDPEAAVAHRSRVGDGVEFISAHA